MSDYNWSKYGKKENSKMKRIAVPVNAELEKVLELFRSSYPDISFSDAKILGTFIEAGARVWISDMRKKKDQETE